MQSSAQLSQTVSQISVSWTSQCEQIKIKIKMLLLWIPCACVYSRCTQRSMGVLGAIKMTTGHSNARECNALSHTVSRRSTQAPPSLEVCSSLASERPDGRLGADVVGNRNFHCCKQCTVPGSGSPCTAGTGRGSECRR
eukprot:15467426-Alexandrium_andersonii.AAC.2